jgi:predicted ribosome quality control (RQC) complex YloA/Tae2 family protein
MNPAVELPNLSLHFLVQELQPLLAGAFVSRIQSIGEKKFKFKLSTKQGSQELVLLPHFVYLTQYRIPSSEQNLSFVQLLRKHIQGKKILSVSQKGWDRILVLEFGELKLVLELFADGNIVLLDAQQKTVACLVNEEWKDRVIRRGKPYSFPASKPVPSDFSEEKFLETLKKNPKKIVSALVSEFNLSPPFAEEAVLHVGIAKEKTAAEIPEKKMHALHSALAGFFSAKQQPVLFRNETVSILFPFPLPNWFKQQGGRAEPVAALNQCLDNTLSPVLSNPSSKETVEQSKRLQKLLHSLEEQKKAVLKLEQQILENQQKGEWVYANYSALLEIKKALEVAEQKGYSKKQILDTFKRSAVPGTEIARKIVELEPRKKTIQVDLSA